MPASVMQDAAASCKRTPLLYARLLRTALNSRGARRSGHDDGAQHEEHAVDGDGNAATVVQHQSATQKRTKAGAQLCGANNEALFQECCTVLHIDTKSQTTLVTHAHVQSPP